MVAVKSHEADRTIQKPTKNYRVILLYGPDAGLVNERAEEFAKNIGVDLTDPFTTIRLNADDVANDRSRLQDEVFTVGMFGGERLIRISGTTRKNFIEAVKPVIQTEISDSWLIIESGDLTAKSPLKAAFEKSKFALAIPCYQDNAKMLAHLIDSEIRNAGFTLTQDTAVLLKSYLGGDRQASRNELEKLALYAHGEKEITKQHIIDIVGDASNFQVSDTIDAVASGNHQKFEECFDRVLLEGISPDILLINTLRHFQMLHEMLGKMQAVNMSASIAVQSARPPIFYQRRDLVKNCLSNLTRNKTELILKRLQTASFEARANPELGNAIAGTCLLACILIVNQSR